MIIKNKLFFNGLNELRAIAALSVVFHHIEVKNNNSISQNFEFLHYFAANLGNNGVFLFFVLSGFLITYLLLQEKGAFTTIYLRKFFMRRICRIWPLYYFVFGISIIVIPLIVENFEIFRSDDYYNAISNNHNYGIKGILFYLFFMPNVALISGYFMIGCSQAWSVGVEEQFYILWPFIILLFNKNRVLQIFVGVLIIFPLLIFLAKNDFIIYPFSVIIRTIPFHFMAIGAIGGYLYYNYQTTIEFFAKSRIFYIITVILIFSFLFYPFFVNYVQEIILSFLFLILIVLSINEKNSLVFRNRHFSFLGKISYGIYMYHIIIMFFVFPIINTSFPNSEYGIVNNLLIYLLTFMLSIVISYFSYKYLELRFIKLKDAKFKTLK